MYVGVFSVICCPVQVEDLQQTDPPSKESEQAREPNSWNGKQNMLSTGK
jgi:hypothetical protein